MSTQKHKHVIYGAFICFVFVNFALWIYVRDQKVEWANVPPVPLYEQAQFMSLADPQMTYRSIAFMLQNLGSTGGDIKALDDYNYEMLADWFFLSAKLDPKAKIIPHLAAFYYTAAQTPKKIKPIIPYLYFAGSLPHEGSWRWLAHGTYLAKHVLDEEPLALFFADELAKLDQPDMPIWTKQMRAFVRFDQGDKEAAYDLMKAMLASEVEKQSPQEIFFMREYICDKILDPVRAKQDPICEGFSFSGAEQ